MPTGGGGNGHGGVAGTLNQGPMLPSLMFAGDPEPVESLRRGRGLAIHTVEASRGRQRGADLTSEMKMIILMPSPVL